MYFSSVFFKLIWSALKCSISYYLESEMFPDELKLAEVVPVYKKNDKKDKNNYWPMSILSNISKIYEKCMQKQLNGYFFDFLSKFQCGFRQGFSTQHWLLVLIGKFREIRDGKGNFSAVLIDLS